MRAIRCIGRSRGIGRVPPSCFCMAGRAPGRHRYTAGFSTRVSGASSCSISAAAAARRRSAKSATTRLPTSSPISSGCAASWGIAEWVVFGGSWGSTLALLYAQTHPERVAGLILRGIFLCRHSEIDWFLYGMRTVFPEAWRAFAGFLPEAERDDLLERLLPPPDRPRSARSHAGGASLEHLRGRLLDAAAQPRDGRRVRRGPAGARAGAHRGAFLHRAPVPARFSISSPSVGRIRHLPAVIVQGRYDMVCPIRSADEWPSLGPRPST